MTVNGQLFENFREIFLHRLRRALELRKRVRPDGAAPFSAPAELGTRTAAGGFALTGGSFFQHRPSGAHELPLAGSPLTGGRFFQHRPSGAHELRQRVRPVRAASFSLNLSRGIRRLRTAGTCGTRRGGKKGRHRRFLPSLNTRFPCCDSLGADGRLRKQEKDATVGLPQRVFLRLFAVHRQRTATQTVSSAQWAA